MELSRNLADQLKIITDEHFNEDFPLIEVTEDIGEPKIGRLKLKK